MSNHLCSKYYQAGEVHNERVREGLPVPFASFRGIEDETIVSWWFYGFLRTTIAKRFTNRFCVFYFIVLSSFQDSTEIYFLHKHLVTCSILWFRARIRRESWGRSPRLWHLTVRIQIFIFTSSFWRFKYIIYDCMNLLFKVEMYFVSKVWISSIWNLDTIRRRMLDLTFLHVSLLLE